jgi:hypothetical protein
MPRTPAPDWRGMTRDTLYVALSLTWLAVLAGALLCMFAF